MDKRNRLSIVVNTVVVTTCCLIGVCSALKQVSINNKNDFDDFAVVMFNGGYNEEVNLDLNIDLDLKDEETTFPLGDPMSCNVFSGTFNGHGHKISNLRVVSLIDDASFLCGFKGMIRDLTIDSSCYFSSNTMATALSIKAEGNATVLNVTNYANVRGNTIAAGLIGLVSDSDSVLIDHCTNHGTITVDTESGSDGLSGFIAEVDCSSKSSIVLKNCVNHGALNAVSPNSKVFFGTGGFLGVVNVNSESSINIHNCTNKGSFNLDSLASVYAGGFVGIVSSAFGDSKINVTDCNNDANISVDSEEISSGGGFIGQITCSTFTAALERSWNYGAVEVNSKNGQAYAGGFISFIADRGKSAVMMNQCMNTGNITSHGSEGQQAFASGLVGSLSDRDRYAVDATYVNCKNIGNIFSTAVAGGIFANANSYSAMSVMNSLNKGTISGTSKYSIGNLLSSSGYIVSKGTIPLFEGSPVYDLCAVIESNNFAQIEMVDGLPFVNDNGNMMRLDGLFNEKVSEEQGWMLWSSKLDLTKGLVVEISETGLVTNVPYGRMLGDITELQLCFTQKSCSVIDAISGSNYSNTTAVHTDMKLNISFSDAGSFEVVIEVNPINIADVDITDVVNSLAMVSDIDASQITVTIEVNDKGEVDRIIVRTKDEDTAERIKSAVNDKKNQNSSNPLVRNMKSAQIKRNDVSFLDLSNAGFEGPMSLLCFVVILTSIINRS